MRFAAYAARATQKRSRATPFVRFCSATFFCALKLLRSFFIAHKKTSHTAGTLCCAAIPETMSITSETFTPYSQVLGFHAGEERIPGAEL
jgi:hypothetical protein